jgi:hypothetical protein
LVNILNLLNYKTGGNKKMDKKIFGLINEKTGKNINNCMVMENGINDDLYSYNTLVCSIHAASAFIVFYDKWDYSATTLKHVKAFLNNCLNIDLNKKDIEKIIKEKHIYIKLYNSDFDVKTENN